MQYIYIYIYIYIRTYVYHYYIVCLVYVLLILYSLILLSSTIYMSVSSTFYCLLVQEIIVANLPPLLSGESYQCVFDGVGSGDLTLTSGDMYSCEVPDIPQFTQELEGWSFPYKESWSLPYKEGWLFPYKELCIIVELKGEAIIVVLESSYVCMFVYMSMKNLIYHFPTCYMPIL